MNGKVYSFLIFAGFLNASYGSISQSDEKIDPCNQRIVGNPFGDTLYLKAIREGDIDAVQRLLIDPNLDLSVQNDEGNTDLMLAIAGGESDEFGENYRKIFDLLVRKTNRDWNLKNKKEQTAILLTVGWNREDCFEALLGEPEVDPNIPNKDGSTPLLAAMATKQLKMALALINCSRVNVNRRGTHGKLPLQIAFETEVPRLVNILCRRSLVDCDVQIKGIVQKIIEELDPAMQLEESGKLQALLEESAQVSMNGYAKCPIGNLIDAIRGKIELISNQLDVNSPALHFKDQLKELDEKTKLFSEFLTHQDEESLRNLCENLK
ncbi:MAG: ankyrin repeat domain-containing protein [Puniceicoccales bacterium]|jgi:ankyrin repeat protein|nr:ankyrin repeat domain-containing protein [Puniceicoccales bacterium]